jgi:hypothetical protein
VTVDLGSRQQFMFWQDVEVLGTEPSLYQIWQ